MAVVSVAEPPGCACRGDAVLKGRGVKEFSHIFFDKEWEKVVIRYGHFAV
jgi:hypothetical protein